MVGIDEHISQIQSFSQLEPEAVRIIGIWGMGGIDERVKRAKVLLILDDVKTSSQIQELIGGHGNFGQGSRIIVTSRDLQVLKNVEADEIYQVNEMSYQDSLRLFTLRAFKPNTPVEGYADLVEEVLKYAKGVPLALQVLGSLLYDKKREVWESLLQKLRKLPNRQIIDVLKLSYDGLDDEEKDIFLDIACFYVGRVEDAVVDFIDACGFSAKVGMDVLKDRCLISIWDYRVVVHDLIQEMGKDIVHQQCANDPGKRSRLWDYEDIYNVLKNNKGTDAIQCIFLDMSTKTVVQLHPETFKSMPNLRMFCLDSRDIQPKVTLSAFLESLPDGLKLLHWVGFPQRSLPLCPENLVELKMRHSKLEQLWEDDQELPNLKRLDLGGSKQLVRIPDLSKFPNIEDIVLSGCASLIEVYSSSFLSKLKCLKLRRCVELTSLNVPSNILSRSSGLVELSNCRKLKTLSINRTKVVESHFDGSSYESCCLMLHNCESLTSLRIDLCRSKLLQKLCLSGCSNLQTFPEIEDTVENLVVLLLDEIAIQELPSSLHRFVGLQELSLRNCSRLEIIPCSIGRLTKLRSLDLTGCESLETFPSSIFKLKLTELDLDGCSKLKTFPKILEPAESFADINLPYTAIKELPSSLDFLVGLQTLCLYGCRNLESLPNSICNLKLLSKLDCSGCRNLTEIPNDIGRLSSLRNLQLHRTKIVNFPESIGHLSSLESLNASYTGIVNLPESIAHLSSLNSLNVSYSEIVNLPESMGHLSSLKSLNVSYTGVVNLPESIAHLSTLKSLNVSGCRKLECIPKLPPFLKWLLAFDCPSITRVISNSTFKHPSDSKEGTFQFHFTSNEDQDPSACSDVVADARLKVIEDAYRFVYYCFPGSAVPYWFPYRCEGDSVTVDKDSLNWCNDNRLIGFAMCFVLQHKNTGSGSLKCSIIVKSDGCTFTLPQEDQLRDSFSCSAAQVGQRDHTFLWKYYLTDSVDEGIFHASSFTFKIPIPSYHEPSYEVKECGICPLYTSIISEKRKPPENPLRRRRRSSPFVVVQI
ncbi:disease resistance protein RPV1-like isoform X2 [Lotus japonicus]|nr:disease resistance protein RPV1-like isoform X2 [Lotus japonicus]